MHKTNTETGLAVVSCPTVFWVADPTIQLLLVILNYRYRKATEPRSQDTMRLNNEN